MNLLFLINLASVGIFGMILSAAFCDILWTRQKRLIMACAIAVMLLVQGIIYFRVSPEIVKYLYPLITHLPLAVLLGILSKKYLCSVISVLTAYLCCQLRRWLSLFVVTIFAGGSVMQHAVELALTLPLLLLLLRVFAPSMRSVLHYSTSLPYQYGLVPALYYGFDYLTRVYTNLLLESSSVAIEFMPFVCSAAYLIFMLRISEEKQTSIQLEQTQASLNLQITQVGRELEALRESWRKTSIWRHDLRHHMQYLSSCIENGRYEQAQNYIHEICSEIETNHVSVFCENEAANLIFSAFAKRIEDYGISLSIETGIPQGIPVSESDLCVLLSNALENALHACQKQKEKGADAMISISAYEKNKKLFLQIINSCDADIPFDHGIPVTDNIGHGIGVRSICAIVERYGGIYSFSVKDNTFILRVSL